MFSRNAAVMTETLEPVTKKKPEPTAEQVAAEELVRRAREQGLSLTGPDGLPKQLTKVVIETALDQELTEHLGHERNTPAGNEAGNVRNGSRPKKVLTEGTGQVQVEVPRDRDGTFGPQIVKKRQRRLGGVYEIILSLYAKGLTTGRSARTLPRSTAPRSRRRPSAGSPTGSSRRCRPGPPGPWTRSTQRSSSTPWW
jgi:putative transposase